MRPVLFLVDLQRPWTFWSHGDPSGWPAVGVAWVWLLLGGAWLAAEAWVRRKRGQPAAWGSALTVLGAGTIAVSFARLVVPWTSFPVFGYGFMIMLGFLAGVSWARRHARQAGLDPELIWDAAFWMLGFGVVGARLFYLVQYHEQVYRGVRTAPEFLFQTINLRGGGLVQIGGLLCGGLAFWVFTRLRRVSALDLADVITPSVFVGICLGRIGCLLFGCCFGDRCTLPWGITFPRGSMPFNLLAERGFVDPEAAATMPLHPTQIYSSFDGLLLAVVTAVLLASRTRRGEVFAAGCLLYSISRFLMEFLRGDEMGQFGTGLTISQWYSLGIALLGLAMFGFLRPLNVEPVSPPPDGPAASPGASREPSPTSSAASDKSAKLLPLRGS